MALWTPADERWWVARKRSRAKKFCLTRANPDSMYGFLLVVLVLDGIALGVVSLLQ
jgi:hypothetical protein